MLNNYFFFSVSPPFDFGLLFERRSIMRVGIIEICDERRWTVLSTNISKCFIELVCVPSSFPQNTILQLLLSRKHSLTRHNLNDQ